MFTKACEAFTRLLFLWVILAGVLGYVYPPSLTFLKDYVVWLFGFTMMGIGAVLKPSDFTPVLKQPHWVLLGTVAQFGIMPALGFAVAKLLRLPPDLAVGVIIVGSAPGAMASNVISYLAKADVAYSVALTSVTTFLAPVLTPTFVYLFGRAYIEVDFLKMLSDVVRMVIVPLLIGFGARRLLRERMDKVVVLFPAISTLFIAFICGLVVALNVSYLHEVSGLVFTAVVLHNGFGLLLGYGAGILYRFDIKRRRTLAFEVGMQNAGLGAILALRQFSAQAALPNALFATWCVITASLLAEYWSRHTGETPVTPAQTVAEP